MKILGASLGELLRHGSQFGLGVQDAQRQNMMQQQQLNEQQRKAQQEQMLAMALLDQRESSAALSRGRLADLMKPQGPKAPTEISVEGGLGNVMSAMPDASDQDILDTYLNTYRDTPGEMARAVLGRRRRQQESDARSAASAARAGREGGDTWGQVVANARGYAETLALNLTKNPSVKSNPVLREQAEKFAVDGLRGRYPQLGADQAASMIRREFRNILDEKGSVILTGPIAEAWNRTFDTPPDSIP